MNLGAPNRSKIQRILFVLMAWFSFIPLLHSLLSEGIAQCYADWNRGHLALLGSPGRLGCVMQHRAPTPALRGSEQSASPGRALCSGMQPQEPCSAHGICYGNNTLLLLFLYPAGRPAFPLEAIARALVLNRTDKECVFFTWKNAGENNIFCQQYYIFILERKILHFNKDQKSRHLNI